MEDGSHCDFSLTPCSQPKGGADNGNSAVAIIPWYRSSKSVRRLAGPLKTLLLDARSALVKEAAELIGELFTVKLQCHPSFLTLEEEETKNEDDKDEDNNEDDTKDADREIDDIFNNIDTKTPNKSEQSNQKPPPPPFVGRLLFKDLLPCILQLSAQTVKVIRNYGVSMTLNLIPHCRVKSALVILLERMKSDKNRNVREDCGRYLRCVLETWPVVGDKTIKMNSRTEEQLSYEAAHQIGMGLGRALTDPAQSVRNETKRGFQVIFQRFRPIWNDVMNSGIIRDVRLRKNLLEAASRDDIENGGGLFDDMASLGDLSLNTSTSFTSMRSNTSYRSYASRGIGAAGMGGGGRNVPSVIGTPKVDRKYGASSSRYSPSTSTTPSSGSKIRNYKESSSTYSASTYVTSSGHVMSSSTPTQRLRPPTSMSPRKGSMTPPPKQPFASLMQTPQPTKNERSPTRNHNSSNNSQAMRQSPKDAKVLLKRLSRRISGIDGLTTTTSDDSADVAKTTIEYKRQLSSIAEKNDDGIIPADASQSSTAKDDNVNNNNSEEITFVALEVISAHLAHLHKVEAQVTREKDLLLDLNKHLGISISDSTNSEELAQSLNKLTEEQVCDYFESVHICVDAQRNASESLLREMERISQGGGGGDVSTSGNSDGMDTSSACGSNNGVMDGLLPQSPLGSKSNGLERVQRDLGAQF